MRRVKTTTDVSLLLQLFDALTRVKQEEFLRMVREGKNMTEIVNIDSIESFLAEHRFADTGLCCPHCGNADVKKHGVRAGRQRFYCKGCHRTFTYATNTVFASAKKTMDDYLNNIHCMLRRMTVRETAEECHCTKNNAFFHRHQMLDALAYIQEGVSVDGIVEADETYTRLSFKGNHKKSKWFTMPREPHMRGERASKRGISNELVCVACSMNRDGKAYSRICCMGRPSVEELYVAFGGHIAEDSVLCTDQLNSYGRFAEMMGLNILQVNSRQRVSGQFGVQRINAYHREFKKLLESRHGVATKYLNNYLVWHHMLYVVKENTVGKETIWSKAGVDMPYYLNKRNFHMRAPIPLPMVA